MGWEALLSVFFMGVALSMDAFAVSVCKGLTVGSVRGKHMLIAGVWFGAFQALMPLIGYYLGAAFHSYIEAFDHWIAFALLFAIGANMIKEAFGDQEAEPADASFGVKTMFVLAVATSSDALAVGIARAMEEDTNIWLSIGVIGITTFLISGAGVKLGSVFGEKYEKKARVAGGVILILLGLKILLEHLGVL